jgi:hypothetical protein
MKPSNGTTLVERQGPAITLPAVALSSALLTSTGYGTAIPPFVNGTHNAWTVVTISRLMSPVAASSLSAMLTDIRSNFQLNNSELALIFRVSRPTLYSWSSETAAPRAANARRAKVLRDASILWREMIGDRTETVSQRFGDRPQLLDILIAAEDEGAAVLESLRELAMARHGSQRVESIAERLHGLGFGSQSAAQQSRALEDHGW